MSSNIHNQHFCFYSYYRLENRNPAYLKKIHCSVVALTSTSEGMVRLWTKRDWTSAKITCSCWGCKRLWWRNWGKGASCKNSKVWRQLSPFPICQRFTNDTPSFSLQFFGSNRFSSNFNSWILWYKGMYY